MRRICCCEADGRELQLRTCRWCAPLPRAWSARRPNAPRFCRPRRAGSCRSGHSLDLHMLAWPFASHSLEIIDETALSSWHMWIVLDIVGTGITVDSFSWLAVVEHHLVEGDHVRLPLLDLVHGLIPD